MIHLLGNILWVVFGGLEMALGWFVAGGLMAVSVVGLPWTPACFRIGVFTLWPFGNKIVDRRQATGQEDLGTGALGCLANVIWFLLGGIWLALGHLILAVLFFVSLIGIPFGVQHLKLVSLTLAPVGKSVVPDR